MIFRPLGGANEIGASSSLIEIDEYRILVDAGIRMNHGHKDYPRLPDFPDFGNEGKPDAVLVTHAHTDHTGALPDLYKRLPADVKIYCTNPTKAITRVLLKDSARRMPDEEKADKGLHYTLDDVAAVLKRMEIVDWLDPVDICPGVTAKWIRAGHILGAAMIYIEGKHESILMTGDVSGPPQLTIPSVDVPVWCCKPDVMVMESTYGNCQHEVTRKQEEKRIPEDVAKVIAEGGTVLLPVFAVGRAQEVILILKYAMEREEIRKFPIYVDGMVRDVNSIYSEFSDDLRRRLKRTAKQDESLFYSDVIKEVSRNDSPEDVLARGPCCIVASSGMLNGGKSVAYAKQLVANPKNLIAITGYQAKRTPGYALEALRKRKKSENRVWSLDDEHFDVKCQVERYQLSAHADSKELLALVQKVQPCKLFPVHGNAEKRKELSKSVRKKFPAIDVELPKNGKSYTVRKYEGIAKGRQLWHDRILSEISNFLEKKGWKGPFSVRELSEIWFGTEEITPVVVKFFQWCLLLDGRFFEQKTAGLYSLRRLV